jgi:fucose permease
VTTGKARSSLLLIALAYASFISLGLPDGLLGVAWPSLRATFGLPIDAIAWLLVTFTAGYLVSSFSSGRVLSRVSVGVLLAVSCLATSVSLLGYAVALRWWMMVGLALVAGAGAGAIDAGLNTFAASRFSARVINWLNGFYGVGASMGPVIMTQVLMSGGVWRTGYAIVGLGQLLLAGCFAMTLKWWVPADLKANTETAPPIPSPSLGQTLRLPGVWLGIAVFFVYTGLEAAAGVWPYSLFTESRGVTMQSAGTWVTVYWAGLTAGRFLSGVVVGRAPVPWLLRLCMIGLVAGAALVWLDVDGLGMGGLALGLMGLSSAPVFPSLIATTQERVGSDHAANAVGFQIAAAVLGQSLLPVVAGVLASRLGLEIIGPTLLFFAVVLFALNEGLNRPWVRIASTAPAVQ